MQTLFGSVAVRPWRSQIIRKNLQTAATQVQGLLRNYNEVAQNPHVDRALVHDATANLHTLGRNLQLIAENLNVEIGPVHELGPKRRVKRVLRLVPQWSDEPPKKQTD
jgi:hypothetical protein